MRSAARFLALAPADRRVVLASLFWIASCRVLLRFAGVARAQAWIEALPLRPGASPPAPAPLLAAHVARAANGLPFRSGCLVRSLATVAALRRQGHDARLRIGVRLEGGALDAHAWAECGGRPVSERDEVAARYAALEAAP